MITLIEEVVSTEIATLAILLTAKTTLNMKEKRRIFKMDKKKNETNDKIIFLDIDGVLRIPKKNDNWDNSMQLNADCCKALKQLLDTVGAFIVLTSSWRLQTEYMQELERQFQEHEIWWWRVLGNTLDLRAKVDWHTYEELRWLEIKDYIKRNNITKYLILDDLDLNLYDKEHFVKTHLKTGLTANLLKTCIKKLENL